MDIRLTGEFVELRPLRVEDAALTLAWRQSPRAGLLNIGARTVDDQAAWIAAQPDADCNLVIETVDDGTPIGMLSLIHIDRDNRRAETSRFLIGDEQRARGIPAAVEAMLLLYQLAFDELGLRRLYGFIAEGNRRMIKWQLYLGMREEGRFREHLLVDGEWQDAVYLGLLEPEYREVALPRMQALIHARPREAGA